MKSVSCYLPQRCSCALVLLALNYCMWTRGHVWRHSVDINGLVIFQTWPLDVLSCVLSVLRWCIHPPPVSSRWRR